MSNTPINPMTQHGAFSWNELMTTDIDSAKSFYSAMFNWKLEESQGDMPYIMGLVEGQQVAGMMQNPPEAIGMQAMWGGYITVDNVEASADKAVSLGGKILIEARDIPKVGRFCVISDPQGAMLSLITYFEQG